MQIGIPRSGQFFGALLLFACLAFFDGCSKSTQSSQADPNARPEATLEDINQALSTWYMAKAAYPSNLTELESAPYFKKRLPTPPAGEKLVLGQDGKAVFVNE